MRRIEELHGMPVVSVSEGHRLGRVKGVELDAVAGGIGYLRVDVDGRGPDEVLPWSGVRSWGKDAVTVDGVDALLPAVPSDAVGRLVAHVGDRPVVTQSGDRLGKISTYEIDEATGRILAYHIPNGGMLARLMGRDLRFQHDDVIAFGKDAIVVRDSVCDAPAQSAAR